MHSSQLADRITTTRISAIITGLLFVSAITISAAIRPNFFSQYSISSTCATFLPLVLVAAGQAIVIIGGGLDLSIGAIAALTSVSALQVMAGQNGRMLLGLVTALAVGGAAGLINGLIVTAIRLQPLITTFATASLFAGVTLWVLPTPGGKVPAGITTTFQLAFAQIPVTALLIVAVIAIWLVARRTRLVRHIYAAGGSPEAAYASLVNVSGVKTSSYVLAGMFAGLAGCAILANSGSGDPFVSGTMALDSIAAVVIGGVALRGGVGSPIGAIVGAMVLSLITAILFFLGISSTYRPLAHGLVVIAALTLSGMANRGQK